MPKVSAKLVPGSKVTETYTTGTFIKKTHTIDYYDYEFSCSGLFCSKWTMAHIEPSQVDFYKAEHKRNNHGDKPERGVGRGGDDGTRGVAKGGARYRPDVVHGHRHSVCGSIRLTCMRDDVPHVVKCTRCSTPDEIVYMDDWIV